MIIKIRPPCLCKQEWLCWLNMTCRWKLNGFNTNVQIVVTRGIIPDYTRGLNKWFCSKFKVIAPEEDWRVQRSKWSEYDNKREDNNSSVNSCDTWTHKYRQKNEDLSQYIIETWAFCFNVFLLILCSVNLYNHLATSNSNFI